MVSRIVKPADRERDEEGGLGMRRDVAIGRFESETGFDPAFSKQGDLGPEADTVRTDHERPVKVDGPTLRQVDDIGLGIRVEWRGGACCR